MRIYLDVCCLNRLMDDQTQQRIAVEAEAVERIFQLLRAGAVEWLCSNVFVAETSNNPDLQRKNEVQVVLPLASEIIPVDTRVIARAQELEGVGYGSFDALHLSCAEAGLADVMLTTDDRFLKKARRGAGSPRVPVLNPVEWLRGQRL